jgi:hypothetical protein
MVEEIDLGFRVREGIGLPAIDAVAQANRSARHRFDECVFSRFYQGVIEPEKAKGGSIKSILARTWTDGEINVASSSSLSHTYIFATINERFKAHQSSPYDVSVAECSLVFPSEVIRRSNIAFLQAAVRALDKSQTERFAPFLDLSDTYLRSDFLESYEVLHPHFNSRFSHAYVELTDWYYLHQLVSRNLELKQLETTGPSDEVDRQTQTFIPVAKIYGNSKDH